MGVYRSELSESRWLRVDAVPLLRAGETAPYEVYTVFEDITRERQDAQALQDAHMGKDHFSATLAHELRDPLALIRHAVAVQQLKHTDDPERVWCQAIIERQVGDMARLPDDLLDSSQIASGKLELRREPVSLHTIEQSLDGARHTLTIALPGSDVMLDADPMRLSQVFSNLPSNAAKYACPGRWRGTGDQCRHGRGHCRRPATGDGRRLRRSPREARRHAAPHATAGARARRRACRERRTSHIAHRTSHAVSAWILNAERPPTSELIEGRLSSDLPWSIPYRQIHGVAFSRAVLRRVVVSSVAVNVTSRKPSSGLCDVHCISLRTLKAPFASALTGPNAMA